MKKTLFIIILSILAALAFGTDFGGTLEDSSIYYSSDNSNSSDSSDFYHADTLSLWLTTELWEDTNLFVQGSYTYTTDDPSFFNLDYLKVENKSASLVNYTFGRFYTSDPTGYIFSHKLDGGAFTFNLPAVIIGAKVGYTGFLFDTNSNIEMTTADQTGVSYDGFSEDFASPRIVGGVEAFFPDLYLHQDLKTGVWAQIDMRDESDVTKENTATPSGLGGKMDTQYFGLMLSGPLVSSLFYDSFVWLGTGKTLSYIDNTYTYEPVVSFLGSIGLRYYMEELLYSRISFRFLYSSGDEDYTSSFTEGNTEDDAANFIPISQKTLALVFSPQLGNIIFTQFSYSLKPFSNSGNSILKNIQFELTDINFFRSTEGQISESGINPSSTSLYLGTEIDGTVNFRPYSDLGVSLSGGVFIPSSGGDNAFTDTREVEYLGQLGLSFSF